MHSIPSENSYPAQVLPEALSESARISAESIPDAQLREFARQQQQMMQFLHNMLRDLEMDEIERSGAIRLPSLGPSRAEQLRMLYNLPSPSDSTIALPSIVASIAEQPATCTLDPDLLEHVYATRVARLAGGTITLDDVLGTPGAMSAAKSTGSGASSASSSSGPKPLGGAGGGSSGIASKTTAYEQQAQAQQEHFNQALKGEQYSASHLFSFIYDMAFAQFDMQAVLDIFDEFDDVLRRHLYEVMTQQPASAASLRALDKQGKRRLMVEEAIDGEEHKKREKTLVEMKHELALKVATQDYVPSTIVFGSAPGEKAKKKALREPETQLDDATHARRMAEMSLLTQQAKDGSIHNDDLRAHNESHLGLQTKKKPPPPPPPASSGGGSKKRARPKSKGSGGSAKKKTKE